MSRAGLLTRRAERPGYAFIAPWFIGLIALTAGPAVFSLVISFTDYDVLSAPEWVGGENYARMLSDPRVGTALGNTLLYTALQVPAHVVVSLGLALLLAQVGRRAAGLFRTVFYLPVMTPAVAVGVLFLLLFNGSEGLINGALGAVGVDGPSWTTDPAWIKPGLVLMSLWRVGASVVILLVALQDVPREVVEAARVDGAGPWRILRSITLPMISGPLLFVIVVNTIAGFQTFTEAYTAFYGAGSTQAANGDAALFYVIYLFQQAFTYLHMGYAAALGWVLFLLVLVVTLVQLRLSRRFVFEEQAR